MQKDLVKKLPWWSSLSSQFKISIYHLLLFHIPLSDFFGWTRNPFLLDVMMVLFLLPISLWMRNVKSPWLESHTWRWQVMSPSYKKSQNKHSLELLSCSFVQSVRIEWNPGQLSSKITFCLMTEEKTSDFNLFGFLLLAGWNTRSLTICQDLPLL